MILNCHKYAIDSFEVPSLDSIYNTARREFLIKTVKLGYFPLILKCFATKTHTKCLRNKSCYNIPCSKAKLTQQAISFWGPRLWHVIVNNTK